MTEAEISLKKQLTELQNTVAELNLIIQKIIADQKAIIIVKDLTIEQLKHRIEQLLKQVYGSKSERLVVQQASLFDPLPFTNQELEPVQEQDKSKTIAEHQRKERKKDPSSLRFELPEHLRREEIIIEPTEIPEGAVRIGEEISEKLEITKAELYVKRTIRPKYVKADKSGFVIADLLEGPIYRCMAGASLLMRILVDKYVDHLPLNRQIDRFARQGVKMKDSTLGDWVTQSAKMLEILYQEMTKEVLSSHYLGADETTIKVLDRKIQGKCHQGYLWVYLSHDSNLVILDYDQSRKKNVVGDMLKDFTGYLQSDGYAGYEQFSTHSGITRLGCMAHARRKFDEALGNDRKTALQAMAMMQRIYRLEDLMRKFKIGPEGKFTLRQRIALPLLNEMFAWMEQTIIDQKITPTSVIGKALAYSIKRKKELMAYLDNGILHIDNNHVENKIRPVAIGRRNYMFMGSHEGAQRSAMIYSFCLSCRLNGINPEEWIEDVLLRINDMKLSEIHTLLPNRWKKKA